MTPNELSEYLKIIEQAASPYGQQLYEAAYRANIAGAIIQLVLGLVCAALTIWFARSAYKAAQESCYADPGWTIGAIFAGCGTLALLGTGTYQLVSAHWLALNAVLGTFKP